MNYNKEARETLRKEYSEYQQYISHSDIISLINNINKNETDFKKTKQLLTNCLNKQFENLPLQNDTLQQKILETFCLMVNNTETKFYLYGARIKTLKLDEPIHPTSPRQTIPKLTPIAKIAVTEWKNEYKQPKNENSIELTTEKSVLSIQNEYVEMDFFEFINSYFLSFEKISVALSQFVLDNNDGTAYHKDILIDSRIFIVDIGSVVQKITRELFIGKDKTTMYNYLNDRFTEIEISLYEWNKKNYSYKDEKLDISIEYAKNCSSGKTLFFIGLLDEDNYKSFSSRIGYLYEKTIDLLSSEKNRIMNLFNNKDTESQTETNNKEQLQPQQIIIPTEILQALETEKLITKVPLKWIGAKNLCAYFVDNYFKNQTKKWEIGKNLFGVKNLAQLKDLYENTNTGKPRGYKTIDKALQING